ncbi:MAG: histidinol-phosphatase [Rhodobacteraceae bacterium]|nr:histidinol-phosphatase [Paracoccaceae bacterium]
MSDVPDKVLSQQLYDAAMQLGDAAAQVTLRYFRSRDLSADNKALAGFDPVTVADREAEQAMREILARIRPDDGILGEEYASVAGRSGLTWVLDPIDGTRGFLSGTPTWGTLIAVCDDTGPIVGMIDQPHVGERFLGLPGGAKLLHRGDSSPMRVSATTRLDDAILFSTFPEIGTPDERAAFTRVADQVRLVRYGMDCYAYGLLALGQIDLVIEAGLNAYDIAAPVAVIEAAGGIVTDWRGGPVWQGGNAVAAATPELHAAALALLQDGAGGP